MATDNVLTEAPEDLTTLMQHWRADADGTYRNWFLWEERIKNFRSIRRGLQAVVQEIEAGTFEVPFVPERG